MRKTTLLLAALAILSLAGSSLAHFRPCHPYCRPNCWPATRAWGSTYPVMMPYYAPMPYGLRTPAAPSAVESAPAPATTSDFEVSGPLSAPPPHTALLRVNVPDTWAKVTIDGKGVDTIGKSRWIVTPPLDGERTYDVSVTWTRDGQSHKRQGQVKVRPGQTRTLNLDRPSGD